MGSLDNNIENIIAEGFQLAKVLSNILAREELKFGSSLDRFKSVGQALCFKSIGQALPTYYYYI